MFKKWLFLVFVVAFSTVSAQEGQSPYKARKIADKPGLKFTGTIGVIIKAKLNGIIPSINLFLKK